MRRADSVWPKLAEHRVGRTTIAAKTRVTAMLLAGDVLTRTVVRHGDPGDPRPIAAAGVDLGRGARPRLDWTDPTTGFAFLAARAAKVS
jgi:hypothetical protein